MKRLELIGLQCVLIFVLGLVCGAAFGDDYYVNDDVAEPGFAAGDDANPGTSPDEPMRNIQSLLDAYPAIGTGDTVHVSTGTYLENICIGSSHSGLTLLGDGPVLTTIDGGASGSCLHFDESDDGTVSGFTLTNGSGSPQGDVTYGGGIYCYNSSPTITNNTITGNAAEAGAGIYCEYNCAPTIANNTITSNTSGWGGGICCFDGSHGTFTDNFFMDNSGTSEGGGIYCYDWSSPNIANNTILENRSDEGYGGGIDCYGCCSPPITSNIIAGNTAQYGGGIECYQFCEATITNNLIVNNTGSWGGGIDCEQYSSPTMTNNTIADNTSVYGGGVYIGHDTPTITNCILWGNTADEGPQIHMYGAGGEPSRLTVSYSDVAGGEAAVAREEEAHCVLTWGPGNIDTDPLFADPESGDYHLKSACGRWDPAASAGAGGWAIDDVNSPCIDAGDHGSDFSNEPQPNGGRINMGAYGNTAEASKAPFALAVQSSPITGVSITGDEPGTTNYTAACSPHQVVILTAPASVSKGGRNYTFVCWFVDEEPQTEGEKDVEVIMDLGLTVTAIYDWRLLGDLTGDCKVDILDMMYLRNRLGTTCGDSE